MYPNSKGIQLELPGSGMDNLVILKKLGYGQFGISSILYTTFEF